LDEKSRLVLPVTIRETLKISKLVQLEFNGETLVLKRADTNSGRAISKNWRESDE
jgi:bifunctional DNA-binding transcriptional regulator/antitoxin component of YhaV-PrlF toxin-antitoxin module